MSEAIIERLKELSDIDKPDIRYQWSECSLLDHRARIEEEILSDTVPREVVQLFETAKNLSLYAWFFYRFHGPVELCAYGALELALRIKAESAVPNWYASALAKPPKDVPPTLGALVRKAVDEKWVKDIGFSVYRHRQKVNAWEKAVFEQIRRMDENDIDEAPSPEIEAFEGHIGYPSYSYLEVLKESIPGLRNSRAHGSNSIGSDSVGTLKRCKEFINQLF